MFLHDQLPAAQQAHSDSPEGTSGGSGETLVRSNGSSAIINDDMASQLTETSIMDDIHIPANWVTWMLILVHQLKPWGEFYFQHPCQMPSTPALLLCRAEWNFKRKKIEFVSYGNNMKRRSNVDGLLLPIQTTYGANWMKIKCVYIHLYVLPPFLNICLSIDFNKWLHAEQNEWRWRRVGDVQTPTRVGVNISVKL